MLRNKVIFTVSLCAILSVVVFGLTLLKSTPETFTENTMISSLENLPIKENVENSDDQPIVSNSTYSLIDKTNAGDNDNDFTNQIDTETYQTISTEVDFAKAYDSFDLLLEDSSVVVSGKVEVSDSYVNDIGQILTDVDFMVKDVLKGNIEDKKIKITAQGGSLTYEEYFAGNKELFKIKLSEEAFNQAEEDSLKRANELVVCSFANTENIKKNETLLLFLNYNEKSKVYNIVGSVHYGKFYYDEANSEYYRLDHEEEIGHKSKKLTIEVDELKTMAK